MRLRKAKVRAVMLDFRGGGRTDTFHQARLVADGLLDGGTLWHWHERDVGPRTDLADRECLFRGLPLVVVVDKNTSGPQAAIAAALQDAGRATIVGTSPSFDGMATKGVELADGVHVLEMGTAKIVRSRANRGWPLKPDVESPVLEVQPNGSIKEYELTEARPNETKAIAVDPNSDAKPSSPIKELTDMAKRLRQQAIRARVPMRRDPISLAHEVIRKLLKAQPDESKETTNRE